MYIHTLQDALLIGYKQSTDDARSIAFSQSTSSTHLIEDETFNDSDIFFISNLIDCEDGHEEPDSLRADVNRHVDDLFEDLRDGHNLISLLEVLSGELLPRERGRMRFHQLQNVQVALDFLKNRNIRLVNIRPEDIVDGNPKLTLGLIWTIILHFQANHRSFSFSMAVN
ncbi:plectin [Trichonephila clavipes]|nr:plectin [Trichonephila clavipes]